MDQYGQYGQDQQQDAYKQALLSQLKSGAPPAAGGAAPPPTGGGNVYNPTTNPGGMQLPNENVVLQGPDGQSRTIPNPRYQPDVMTGPWDPPLPPQAAPPAQQNANPGYVPGGWDATKWNDPNKHDLKYDLGHLLAGVSNNGLIGPDDVAKIAPQLEKMGIKWDGGDGLTMPDGNRVDFIKGMKAGGGKGQLNWLDSTMQGGSPWAGAASPAAGATPPVVDPSFKLDPSSQGDMTPEQSALWQKIMAQMNDPNNAHLMETLTGALGNMQQPALRALSAGPAAGGITALAQRLKGTLNG